MEATAAASSNGNRNQAHQNVSGRLRTFEISARPHKTRLCVYYSYSLDYPTLP